MATITEKWPSREGTIVGPWGITNVSRFFHVKVDAITDEPGVTIQNPRGGVPPGQVHPKFPGLFAVAYERGRRLATYTHEVWVWYGDPLTFPTEQLWWDYEADGDFAEVETFYDLDGKPIGHPAFREWPEETSAPSGELLFRTDTKYGRKGLLLPPASPGTPSKFYARPISIPSQTGTVIFRRTAANPPSPPGTAFGARGSVNNSPLIVRVPEGNVNFGPTGRFLLERVRVGLRPGTLVGQRTTNVIYDYEVVFRYSATPWTPYKLRILYVAQDGSESEVFPVNPTNPDGASKPLEESYKIMRTADHSQVMDALISGGGEINIGGPILPAGDGPSSILFPIRQP